jgi:hypothetical protein
LPNLPPPPTISNNNQNTVTQKVANLPPKPNNLPDLPNNLSPFPMINTQTQRESEKILKTESIVESNRNSSKISE